MEKGRISDGIQATIELLEAIPVRGKDIESIGFGLYTAIKNLYLIKDAVVRAENGEVPEEDSKETQAIITEEASDSESDN